jgi:hypothetical protein
MPLVRVLVKLKEGGGHDFGTTGLFVNMFVPTAGKDSGT